MKQTVKIVALLLLLAGLLSCSLFGNLGESSLRIDIAPVASAGINDPYARVWLVSDGKLFALSGDNAYLAAQLSEMEPTTIVIEGIPVGPRYRVLLAKGFLRDGWFDTQEWAESADIELEAGVNTRVSLAMQSSPFYNNDYPSIAGKNLRDVVVMGSNIYTTTTGTLYTNSTGYPYNDFAATAIEPGYSANSLTEGIDFSSGLPRLWINSSKGVLPFYVTVAPVFDTTFSTKLGAVPVLDSAARAVFSDHVLYFRREGGLGGVYAPYMTMPDSWTWVNKDSDRVYDLLCAAPGEGYFATSGGAFRLPSDFLLDATPSIAEHKLSMPPPAKVLSWGFIDQYGDGDVLFMGTEDGAWRVRMNQGVWFTTPPDNLQRIAGTEGESIRMTEAEVLSGYEFAAFLSPLALHIYDGYGGSLTRYPFHAGLPGRVTGMAWRLDASGSVWLIISGEEGLVYIYVNYFSPV